MSYTALTHMTLYLSILMCPIYIRMYVFLYMCICVRMCVFLSFFRSFFLSFFLSFYMCMHLPTYVIKNLYTGLNGMHTTILTKIHTSKHSHMHLHTYILKDSDADTHTYRTIIPKNLVKTGFSPRKISLEQWMNTTKGRMFCPTQFWWMLNNWTVCKCSDVSIDWHTTPLELVVCTVLHQSLYVAL